MATKYSSSSVERALSEATRKLSFDELKSKQKEAVISFQTVQLYITTWAIKSLPSLPTGYTINVLSTHSAFIPLHASLGSHSFYHVGQSKNGARDFY